MLDNVIFIVYVYRTNIIVVTTKMPRIHTPCPLQRDITVKGRPPIWLAFVTILILIQPPAISFRLAGATLNGGNIYKYFQIFSFISLFDLPSTEFE